MNCNRCGGRHRRPPLAPVLLRVSAAATTRYLFLSTIIEVTTALLYTPALHTPALHTPALHTPALHTPALHTPAFLVKRKKS
ncbi:hypothetical protein FHG87_005537 [Trinorchestia longiramus]|nr:hypothetical protein FHG87_005537 [Trinorchestia longiramus]